MEKSTGAVRSIGVSKILLKNLRAKKEAEGQLAKFVSWFLKVGQKKIVSKMDIAQFLSGYMIGDITDARVGFMVTQARRILEDRKGMSIWNVKGEGYRIATEKEKAKFLVFHTNRALKAAERVTRLYVCTDRRLIREAIDEKFGSQAKASGLVHSYERQLLAICSTQKLITNGKA